MSGTDTEYTCPACGTAGLNKADFNEEDRRCWLCSEAPPPPTPEPTAMDDKKPIVPASMDELGSILDAIKPVGAKLQIGKFILWQIPNGDIWIQDGEEDGGSFPVALLEKNLKAFYDYNF